MQTEFPRPVYPTYVADDAASDVSAPTITDDDLELIDLRYDQFIALAQLDHLMEEL